MHDIVVIGTRHDWDLVGLEQGCRYIPKVIIAHASCFGPDLQQPLSFCLLLLQSIGPMSHTLTTSKPSWSCTIVIWPRAEHFVTIRVRASPKCVCVLGIEGKEQLRKAGLLFRSYDFLVLALLFSCCDQQYAP